MRTKVLVPVLLVLLVFPALGFAAGKRPPHRDRAVYLPKQKFPVLEEMKKKDEERRKQEKEETKRIVDEIEKREKEKKDKATELRFDLEGIEIPAGPDAFEKAWHFPPTPQYRTGTCWSFSTTSFLESEVKRLHGREVKLSEMWPVYWEYVEKARGYVRARGKMHLGEGSESNAVLRAWKEHGIVPQTIRKAVSDILEMIRPGSKAPTPAGRRRRTERLVQDFASMGLDDLQRLLSTLEQEMGEAAADLRFEYAARLRDEIREIERELRDLSEAV